MKKESLNSKNKKSITFFQLRTCKIMHIMSYSMMQKIQDTDTGKRKLETKEKYLPIHCSRQIPKNNQFIMRN